MSKKILAIVSATVLAASLLVTGCSGGAAPSGGAKSSSSATVADKSADITKLTVGFDDSYPPYGFIGDDGEYTGLDLELAKEVANRNGWEFEATPIDWDAKDALLGQGTVNCIWNGFTIEGREDQYTFSAPYMLNQQVVVVKAGSNINDAKDLAGKTVITQIDSAALDVLQGDQAALAATFGKLDQISDYNNAFMQLEAGTVDAVACDLSIAAYQMAANPDKYVQLSEPLSSEHYGVGFVKGSNALAQKVTDTLKAMVQDGTAKKICEKYAEYGVNYDANWVLK